MTSPSGFSLPSTGALLDEVRKAIGVCGAEGVFASPPVTTLRCEVEKKSDKGKEKRGRAPAEEAQDEDTSE